MTKKFEKLKIELSENNERIFREAYQFIERNYSFEEFVNDWIADELRIRILLDENPKKAKQLLTDLIGKFEIEHYKMGEKPK
jgi:hypothetical protein